MKKHALLALVLALGLPGPATANLLPWAPVEETTWGRIKAMYR